MSLIMRMAIVLLGLKMMVVGQALAQESALTKEQVIEQIIEMLASDASEESDISMVAEDLERLSQSPLDLNRATREQLEQLPFLNANQINNLMQHIAGYGQLFTLNELMGIDGFNEETIRFLQPFTQLVNVETAHRKSILSETNVRIINALESSKGFVTKADGSKAYPGIHQKLYLRHQTSINQSWNLGITAETDAGEHFFKENNRSGFDYYSGFAQYSGSNKIRSIIIGDYQAKFGQGLIQWSGYGLRKSAETARLRYMGQGIRPYTSTDENAGLRGIATQLRLGAFDVIAFYSNRMIDANVSLLDDDGTPAEVSSILATGYHRTVNELADEDVLREQLAGVSTRFTQNRFSTSLNANILNYSVPLIPENKPYNEFRFQGNSNYNISTDWTYIFNKASLFGEVGFSESRGTGIVAGLEAQPANEFSFTLLYRNYQRNFQSIRGASFSESTLNNNEQGIYSGFVLFPLPKVRLSGYIDAYEFPWIKYTTNGPVRGTDMQLQLNYRPIRKVEIYARYKQEQNAEKTSLASTIKPNAEQIVQRIRLNTSWQINKQVALKARAEWSGYNKDNSLQTGLLIMGDLDTHFFNERLGVQIRLAWYNTDGYNARIYAYENDMPFLFSIPAYYGEGVRTYLKISYKISSQLTIYARYSRSQLQNGQTFGSGNDFIDSNSRSDVRCHLKFRF